MKYLILYRYNDDDEWRESRCSTREIAQKKANELINDDTVTWLRFIQLPPDIAKLETPKRNGGK